MAKITTDLAGGETATSVKAKITAILQFWRGSTAMSGVTNWGQVRALLNGISDTGHQILNEENYASFALDLNWLNNPDNVVPGVIFSGDRQGVWFDPSDLTTLYQDAAGTTPVTAPGQSVGRVLDKSGRGNHATQTTAAARPTYGVEPLGGRRNLLTYTEQFDNAAWLKGNATITPNSAVAPDGTMTADKIVENTLGGNHTASQVFAAVSGTTYTISAFVRAAERDIVQLRFMVAALWGGQSPTVSFNLTDQTTQIVVGSAFVGYGIQNNGGGIYRVWATYTATASGSAQAGIQLADATGSPSYLGDGTSGLFVWGAQIEPGTPTPYQRVGSAFDVTEAGVPSLSYLSFDGVDDFLQTGNIAWGTDEVTVTAGVRKLTDAAQGVVAELGVNSGGGGVENGVFGLLMPRTAGQGEFAFNSKGTVTAAITSSGFAAPQSAVLTFNAKVATDLLTLRRNGVQIGTTSADQGTGNYSTNPLYIGMRAGTSAPFNGMLFGLTAVNAVLDATQLGMVELSTNFNTGGF